MSEKGEIVQSAKQLMGDEQDMNDIPFKQYEMMLKHTPDVINAVSNMGGSRFKIARQSIQYD